MTDPCDVCETYHRLGWDACPACFPQPVTPPPAVDARHVLGDVAEQMGMLLYERELPTIRTMEGWHVLLLEASRGLRDEDIARLHAEALAIGEKEEAPAVAVEADEAGDDEWDSAY